MTRELQALVREARPRKAQREWLIVAVGVSIIAGMVPIRVLIAVLSWGGGDWLAGVMVGGRSPWQPREVLMQDADPASFDKMAKLYKTCGSRSVAFRAAAIALDEAANAGKGSGAEALPRPPPALPTNLNRYGGAGCQGDCLPIRACCAWRASSSRAEGTAWRGHLSLEAGDKVLGKFGAGSSAAKGAR